MRLKDLIKESATYGTVNVIEKAIPFLVLPYVSRVFSLEQMGLYVLFQVLLELLIPIMTNQLNDILMIKISKADTNNFSKVIYSNMAAFYLWFLGLAILLSVAYPLLSAIFKFDYIWFILILLTIFFRHGVVIAQQTYQLKLDTKPYATLTLGLICLRVLLSFGLLYFTNLTWEAFVLGSLVSYAMVGLRCYNKQSLISKKVFNYRWLDIRNEYLLSTPLLVHRLGLFLTKTSNKLVVSVVLGTQATGSFGIGASMASIMTVIEQSISKTYKPRLYKHLALADSSKSNTEEVDRTKRILSIFIVASAIIISVIGYFYVGKIFGEKYNTVSGYVIPLVAAAGIKGLYELDVNYLMFYDRSKLLAKITIAIGLLGLPLYWIFTNYWGLQGVALLSLFISILQYSTTKYFAIIITKNR